MLTINDLGRAAHNVDWSILCGNRSKDILPWDEWTDEQREVLCKSVLAGVDLFVKAYCAHKCPRCREGHDAQKSDGLWWHDGLHYECYASGIRNFIASLKEGK